MDETNGHGTTHLTITYTATEEVIFDDYKFTINDTESTEKSRMKENADRTVRFENLIPGTLYTIEAVVVSHGLESEAVAITKQTCE